MDKVTIVKLLGSGEYGRVYSAIHEEKEQLVVLKVVPFKGENTKQVFDNEVTILQKLKNQSGVVNILDSFSSETMGGLVLERMEYDLFDFLFTHNNQLTPSQAREMFYKLCLGVKQCHSKNIAHLDIKLENILLNADASRIVLADFGMSRMNGNAQVLTTRPIGTPFYAAPEVYDKFIPMEADIWSLGIVFHVLLTGTWPYNAESDEKLKFRATNGMVSIQPGINSVARDLLGKLLNRNPKERATINEILSHPYFYPTTSRSESKCSIQ